LGDLENLAESSQAYLGNWPGRLDGWDTVVSENWENIITHQKGLGKTLLSRINTKTEEVKGLLDGVGLNVQVF